MFLLINSFLNSSRIKPLGPLCFRQRLPQCAEHGAGPDPFLGLEVGELAQAEPDQSAGNRGQPGGARGEEIADRGPGAGHEGGRESPEQRREPADDAGKGWQEVFRTHDGRNQTPVGSGAARKNPRGVLSGRRETILNRCPRRTVLTLSRG